MRGEFGGEFETLPQVVAEFIVEFENLGESFKPISI